MTRLTCNKSFLLFILWTISQTSFGQWSTDGNNIYNTNYNLNPKGKVGIGMLAEANNGNTKTSILQIKGISGNNTTQGYLPSPIVTISSEGQTPKLDIGIGTGTYGVFLSTPNNTLRLTAQEVSITNGKMSVGAAISSSYNFATTSGVFSTGLSVGTSNPLPSGYKVAVDGKIICEEVVVEMSENWPDYVFDQSYNLKSLDSVKAYVETEHHLPEIPSAKELESNGIPLSEMVRLQMIKIEELTLYLIELKEHNNALEKKVMELVNQK